MGIKFNLSTYAAFKSYEDKMTSKNNDLLSQQAVKESELANLQQQYLKEYTEGDTIPVAISSKIANVKTAISLIRDELDLISASDLREKQMAKDVYREFQSFLVDVGAEQNRMWEESVQILQVAYDKVMELNREYNTLHENASILTSTQFIPVVDHLDIDEESKTAMKHRSWVMPGTPLTRAKDHVHFH